LLAGAFKKFGVSKIQGFQGKYISNMSLAKNIIVRAWGSPANPRSDLFMGKTEPTGKCPPRREDIFKYGNFLFDIPLLLHF
jgi:hypothetical protein